MPRGGPRPGAGAPVGNLNALKHGRSSRRVRGLLDLLITIPEVRGFLLALWARSLDGPPTERRRQLKALAYLMDSIAQENKQRLHSLLNEAHRENRENNRTRFYERLHNQSPAPPPSSPR